MQLLLAKPIEVYVQKLTKPLFYALYKTWVFYIYDGVFGTVDLYEGENMNKSTRYLTEAAVIAALYAVLTIVLAPISYGQIQIRVSEILTILPFFTPAAIPGLFIGCIVANIFGGLGPIDIIFGSLATLVAAYLTYKMPKKILAPLPPVIVNAVVVGLILYYVYEAPLIISMLWVGLGEGIVCFVLGYPVLLQLDKLKSKIFSK